MKKFFQNHKIIIFFVFLSILLFPCTSQAQIEVTLKKEFIEKYKNRGTINTTFTIDKAHAQPNSPAKDGDMHVAGRAPEIGLPTVAEIMNAKGNLLAVKRVKKVEATGTAIKISGAWRLWCEHAGTNKQVQDQPLEAFDTTNPEHVFEIHPITSMEGTQSDINLLSSLIPIVGFQEKSAESAFTQYERTHCKITDNNDGTVTIRTEMAGFNYVKFKIEIKQDQGFISEDDGTRFLFATIYGLNDELIVFNRRMVFIKDSPPEKKVKNLRRGAKITVLGIPRISLNLISYRLQNPNNVPDILDWNLPYEMIIVGVY